MIRKQVFSFPVFGRRRRRRRPIYHSSEGDDIWDVDPDDIDKERDAVMYKREALEACLRVEYVEKEEDDNSEEDKNKKSD